MRRNLRAAPIPLLASLLWACGSPPEPPEDERTSSPLSGPGVVVIRMLDDMTFDPAHPVIAAGDTVVWVNAGKLPHTATADPERTRDPARVALPEGAAGWDSGALGAGEEFRQIFTIPGRYAYVCTLHEMMGMVGTLEVEL